MNRNHPRFKPLGKERSFFTVTLFSENFPENPMEVMHRYCWGSFTILKYCKENKSIFRDNFTLLLTVLKLGGHLFTGVAGRRRFALLWRRLLWGPLVTESAGRVDNGVNTVKRRVTIRGVYITCKLHQNN